MRFGVRQTVRYAWLALAAMLMSVLAPTVSQAIAAAAPAAYYGEVCSIDGQRPAPSARDAQGPGPIQVSHAHEQCPYCFFQGGAGVPPATGTAAIPPLRDEARWMASPPAVLSASEWPAAQPRAPPARN